MFTSSNHTHPNLLMCIDVGSLLAPKHQAYLQNAGRAGDGIITELLSLHRIVAYIDNMEGVGGGDEKLWSSEYDGMPPTRIALAAPLPTLPPYNITTVTTSQIQGSPWFVFSHAAMSKLGGQSVSPPPPPAWESLHWPRIRYEWDDGDDEFQLLPPPVKILRYSTATYIELSGFECVSTISDFFLAHCQKPTSISLQPLCNVTYVGCSFMAGCRGLQSIDLSPLRSLTSISHYFLQGCSSLTSLNLSPLLALHTVGSAFLQGCGLLTQLDISALHRLTTIQNGFLMECKGITSLDLSPLTNVTSIGDCFLVSCTSLSSLDLLPLSNITSLGLYFMATCTGVSELDLSPLTQIPLARKQGVLTYPINNRITHWQ